MRFRGSATVLRLACALVLGALTGVPTADAQTASWLDGPPVGWNTAGAELPTAPAMQNTDPRCREREDAPSSPEENQVTGRGWKLEGYWPTLRSGNLVLVSALADYDGMCRPMEFNVFVFSGGSLRGHAVAGRNGVALGWADPGQRWRACHGQRGRDNCGRLRALRGQRSAVLSVAWDNARGVSGAPGRGRAGREPDPDRQSRRGRRRSGGTGAQPGPAATGMLVDQPLATSGLAGLGALLVLFGAVLRRRASGPM